MQDKNPVNGLYNGISHIGADRMEDKKTVVLLVDRFSPVVRRCLFSSRWIHSVVFVSTGFMFQGVVGFI